MNTETVQWVQERLKEHSCSGIEFDNLPQVLFQHRRLIIYCGWRIVHDEEIIAASDLEEEIPGNVAALLKGTHVWELVVHAPFHDLEVRFDNGAVLQTFSDSWKHESWNFWCSPQELVVAGPGALWSRWEPTDETTVAVEPVADVD